jgi:tetratricopeptide (TPR) repeat protein
VLELLREAEVLAKGLDDRRRLGRVADYLAFHAWLHGEPERAMAEGERALALAEASDDADLRIVAGHHLGLAYYARGEYMLGIETFRRTVAALTAERRRAHLGLINPPSITSRTYLAWCLGEVGAFAQGIAVGREALALAEAIGQPLGVLAALRGLGSIHLRQGDLDHAVPLLERGLALCRRGGTEIYRASFTSYLGYALSLAGRLAEALPLLEEAVDHLERMRVVAEHALRVTWLGEGCLAAGRVETAAEHAGHALDLARRHGERGTEAWALRLRAGVLAARGLPADAAATYREALARAVALGMRPLVAHCHGGLASVSGPAEAPDHRALAASMWGGMNMRRGGGNFPGTP